MSKLTVVISTRQKDENYLDRIRNTAGVDVDILCYENNGQYSLTELYNRGLKESTTEVILYMHDDLGLENEKWGLKILKHFENSDFGILGVAGTIKLNESTCWWQEQAQMCGQVYHQAVHPETGKLMKWLSEFSGKFPNEILPVVVVDGLFFAVNKTKIKKEFDEEVKGFHLYEIDFCINNHLDGVKIGVISDVTITHKSIGKTNDEWEKNREQVAKKYEGKLPLEIDPIIVCSNKPVSIKKQPFVSVIIPTKGNIQMLKECIYSIVKTAYSNYEIIVADTGSSDEEKEEIRKLSETLSIYPVTLRMVEYDYYNYAKINNDVVKNHLSPKTELILFSNNDIVFQNDCLSIMVDTHQKNRPTCGTVGARLHFENNKVQHAGIYLSKQKDSSIIVAGHVGYNAGYQYQNKTYTVVGNTAALLLISKVIFEKVGYFNELYGRCFEDVEMNLKVLMRNCKNYLCGEAVAYHKESATRTPGVTEDDLKRMNLFVNNNITKLGKYIIEPK